MRSQATTIPTPHLSPTNVVAAALVAAVTLAVITGAVPVPDFTGALEDASDTLGAALLAAVVYGAFLVLRARSGAGGHGVLAHESQRHQAADGTEGSPEEPSRDHVEREVHTQIDPRERHGGGEHEHGGTKLGTQDRDGGRGGEGRGAVTRGERG